MNKNEAFRFKYLLWYAHEHIEFRIPELESLASLFNIPLPPLQPILEEPYLILDGISEEDLRKILSRSILIKSLIELWSEADSQAELHKRVQALPPHVMAPYKSSSFKINVETYGKRQTLADKIHKIEEFDYLPLDGPIQLQDPELPLHLFCYHGLEPNSAPPEPLRVFLGRWVCDGQRRLLNKYSLKTRKFIGNTSMDPTLAFCMANMARVQRGDLVLDPFVGSGSLLVAAALWGGHVWGTDLDFLMLHGKAKPTRYAQKKRAPDESILTNLRQYKLESQYLDVLVADSTLTELWMPGLTVDSIITDPPYGIREAAERIGSNKPVPTPVPPHLVRRHIPQKVTCGIYAILGSLLSMAAQRLRVGGRLVCWVPQLTSSPHYLPGHPALRLIAASTQLCASSTRVLLTMEKIREPLKGEVAYVPEAMKTFRQDYFNQGS